MGMDACMLCPRMCGVDRESGEKGYCGMDGKLRAARAALHKCALRIPGAGRGICGSSESGTCGK